MNKIRVSFTGRVFEPEHDKTNQMIRSSNEDLGQPGHPYSLSLRCPPEEGLDHQLLKRTDNTLKTYVPGRDVDCSFVLQRSSSIKRKKQYYKKFTMW